MVAVYLMVATLWLTSYAGIRSSACWHLLTDTCWWHLLTAPTDCTLLVALLDAPAGWYLRVRLHYMWIWTGNFSVLHVFALYYCYSIMVCYVTLVCSTMAKVYIECLGRTKYQFDITQPFLSHCASLFSIHISACLSSLFVLYLCLHIVINAWYLPFHLFQVNISLFNMQP